MFVGDLNTIDEQIERKKNMKVEDFIRRCKEEYILVEEYNLPVVTQFLTHYGPVSMSVTIDALTSMNDDAFDHFFKLLKRSFDIHVEKKYLNDKDKIYGHTLLFDKNGNNKRIQVRVSVEAPKEETLIMHPETLQEYLKDYNFEFIPRKV